MIINVDTEKPEDLECIRGIIKTIDDEALMNKEIVQAIRELDAKLQDRLCLVENECCQNIIGKFLDVIGVVLTHTNKIMVENTDVPFDIVSLGRGKKK